MHNGDDAYDNDFSDSYGKICFTLFIAKMTRYIFGLIMSMWFTMLTVYRNVFL